MFDEWLTRQYLEWRGDKVGREGSLANFSRWLKIPQPMISEWMSGKKTPSSVKVINKLADKFGPEVYIILGLDAPQEALDALAEDELLDYVKRRLGPGWELVYRSPGDGQSDKP